MTWILERDRLSTPSWIREQASIQLAHPWHFSMSTRRYPSAGGIASARTGICPVPGVLVDAGAVVGTGVLVGAGVLVGDGVLVDAGLSSALKSLQPPVPATMIMAPVTLRKSRRVIAATPSLGGAPTEFVLFPF
jgi:hypothetical protein